MKSEDEIMAEYLLKGGKMISATCPSCGCPLFEIDGQTLCVVCREAEKRDDPAGIRGEQPAYAAGTIRVRGESPRGTSPALAVTLEETLVALSLRIREEPDPERVMVLVNALKRGIEALRLLG